MLGLARSGGSGQFLIVLGLVRCCVDDVQAMISFFFWKIM